jgi:hypothetical protein
MSLPVPPPAAEAKPFFIGSSPPADPVPPKAGPSRRVTRQSISPVISDCGFRISFAIFSNPHSAIHNPQLHEVLSLSIRNPQSAIRNWEMGFSIDPRGRMC